jgi:FAD/FMN-containing dehydrogenase
VQSTISIPRLRTAVNGRVITPDDPAYDQARTGFYGGIDRRPQLIIRVADAGDVARVVELAGETGLELAVRGGGHSLAGHSTTDGGIVLDLADMRALDVNAGRRTAWAQTGLTAGEYTTTTTTAAYGLATGFGDTASVGIGGLTLGGGVGYLVRKHGLTIDDLLAAELVTADGQLLRTDAQAHPDLFWAIRGRLVIMATLAYAGAVADGERAVAPFRALATPIADLVRPMPYPEIYPPEEKGYHPTVVLRTMFVDTVDRRVAETIVDHLQASDAALRFAQLRVLGGAMARVPADATAFAHRTSPLMVNVAALYDGPADQAARAAWVEEFAAALRQGEPGAYVGFLADEDQVRVRQAYPGRTWDRLAAIKARWDPTNLFHRNQNIPQINGDADGEVSAAGNRDLKAGRDDDAAGSS